MTIYWSTTHCAFPFDHGSKRTAGQSPLSGTKVIELGNFNSAPFASRLLAGFGVDFIKVEPPGASETHNRAKKRISCEQSLARQTQLAAAIRDTPVAVNAAVATAFRCPMFPARW
jgi:crotonobetainyl-CoA:carnitine CoA-transferase CaiB-like acyl-CoA transferase